MKKKCINNLCFQLGILGSYFFGYRLMTSLKNIRDKFYTGYLGRKFQYLGKECCCVYPITIRGEGISLGRGSTIQRYTTISTVSQDYNGNLFRPTLMIGDDVSIGEYCHISALNSITLGDGVLLGRRVMINDNTHGNLVKNELNMIPLLRPLNSKGAIVIGDGVWIGENCMILGGVTLGKNCIVGCGSVVTKSFPDNAIIAGNPARLIRIIV